MEHAHAFFSRVLAFSHLTSSTLFLGKPELFAWTCSLVAYCLWTQVSFLAFPVVSREPC